MEIIDNTVLELFDELGNLVMSNSQFLVGDAQALAALFMLLYFGIKSWGLISGDEKWEIMPLLRPFALTIVLLFWPAFVATIEIPFEIIEGRTQSLYQGQVDEVNRLMELKSQKMTEYAEKLTEISSDVESVEGEDSDEWYEIIGVDFDAMINEAKSLYLVVMSKLRYMMEQIILFIVMAIFQLCVYIIFFLQMFFKYILVVLGPFAFAFSIIPAFRDSYTTWIGRFISVCLYASIARLVMIFAFVFIQYALDIEIQQLDLIMQSDEAFLLFATASGVGQIGFIVALLVGAVGMLTVPVISTWIVNTSGIGQAVGKMTSGGISVASGGASALKS
jgi:hypothetical protein